MSQPSLACQIAPALDTDEDRNELPKLYDMCSYELYMRCTSAVLDPRSVVSLCCFAPLPLSFPCAGFAGPLQLGRPAEFTLQGMSGFDKIKFKILDPCGHVVCSREQSVENGAAR